MRHKASVEATSVSVRIPPGKAHARAAPETGSTKSVESRVDSVWSTSPLGVQATSLAVTPPAQRGLLPERAATVTAVARTDLSTVAHSPRRGLIHLAGTGYHRFVSGRNEAPSASGGIQSAPASLANLRPGRSMNPCSTISPVGPTTTLTGRLHVLDNGMDDVTGPDAMVVGSAVLFCDSFVFPCGCKAEAAGRAPSVRALPKRVPPTTPISTTVASAAAITGCARSPNVIPLFIGSAPNERRLTLSRAPHCHGEGSAPHMCSKRRCGQKQ